MTMRLSRTAGLTWIAGLALAAAVHAAPPDDGGPLRADGSIVQAAVRPDGSAPVTQVAVPARPKVPVLTGVWHATGLTGDAAVELTINQQSNLPGEFSVARFHKAHVQLSDPRGDKTGRSWARTLEGFVNVHGELHAMGDFSATWGNSSGLPARTMLYAVLKGSDLRVSVHSQVWAPEMSELLLGWDRFQTFTRTGEVAK